jgi:O-antigen/teichoic acid export membrane protein
MTLLVPAAVLGQYAVAATWSGVVMLLGGGLLSVLLARSAAVGADASAGQMRALFAQFRLVVLAVGLLGGVAALAAPITVPLLFGRAFAPAVLPAILLCLSSVIFTLTLALHEIARGLGYPGAGIPAEVARLGVAAVFLLLLLRPLGGTGAAIASIAGCSTALVVLAIRLDVRFAGRLLPSMRPSKSDVTALSALVRRELRIGHVHTDRSVK